MHHRVTGTPERYVTGDGYASIAFLTLYFNWITVLAAAECLVMSALYSVTKRVGSDPFPEP